VVSICASLQATNAVATTSWVNIPPDESGIRHPTNGYIGIVFLMRILTLSTQHDEQYA
jgi:hypothetical protein